LVLKFLFFLIFKLNNNWVFIYFFSILREPNTKLIKIENQAWSQINWTWKDKIEEQRNLKWQEKKKTSTTQLFSINEHNFLTSKSSINGVTIFTRQPNLWKKKQKTGKNPKITLQNTQAFQHHLGQTLVCRNKFHAKSPNSDTKESVSASSDGSTSSTTTFLSFLCPLLRLFSVSVFNNS